MSPLGATPDDRGRDIVTEEATIGPLADSAGVPIGEAATVAVPYREAVETGDLEALTDLYRRDALLDAHVPGWRFQVQGRAEVAAQVAVLPRPGRFAAFDVETTANGLLVRFEWRQDDGAGGAAVRQLHWWALEDGDIAEHTLFCAGVWSPTLQARMAVDAPLVRP